MLLLLLVALTPAAWAVLVIFIFVVIWAYINLHCLGLNYYYELGQQAEAWSKHRQVQQQQFTTKCQSLCLVPWLDAFARQSQFSNVVFVILIKLTTIVIVGCLLYCQAVRAVDLMSFFQASPSCPGQVS